MKLIAVTIATYSAAVAAMSIPLLDQSAIFAWNGFDSSAWKPSLPVDNGDEDFRTGRKEGGSILERLREEKRFSKLVDILEEHRGLRDDLERSDAKFTFFAPTNDAIEKLKEEMRHHGEKGGKGREHGMDQVIRYHMVPHELTKKDLFDGMTLSTQLKLSELNGKPQRIRVTECSGNVILNMYARVVEREMEAENGVIMAVDNVLVPPPDVMSTLYYLPTKFSTFLSAVHRVGLEKDHERHKAITAFVPPNAAWETLGFHNLMYLFSEEGKSDLKKVVQYHLSTQLIYADKMIEEEKFNLETLLRGEKLSVHVSPRKSGKSPRRYDDWLLRKGEAEHHCPAEYIFSVNNGEASVVFTDAIAENGNIQLINSVLVPESVRFPEEKRRY